MSYTGAEREEKVKQMTASLLTQQQFFFHANKAQENATIASYEVAQLVGQHEKPFTEGAFIKLYLAEVVGVMCPEKMQNFNNVSMSRLTIVPGS